MKAKNTQPSEPACTAQRPSAHHQNAEHNAGLTSAEQTFSFSLGLRRRKGVWHYEAESEPAGCCPVERCAPSEESQSHPRRSGAVVIRVAKHSPSVSHSTLMMSHGSERRTLHHPKAASHVSRSAADRLVRAP